MTRNTEQEISTDFGRPGPKTCGRCDTEFYRSLEKCPECGAEGTYRYTHHPHDQWTSKLVRQVVKSLAGYGALHIEYPADSEAYLWWDRDEGFQGRSRYPTGAWDSFSLGVGESVGSGNSVELVHWTECPGQIRRQMREALPKPQEAREA